VISTLRSVGVTVKEIAELGNAYLSRPDDPLGPQVAALLDRAERRTELRIAELSALLGRLREYRQRHAAALAGELGVELFGRTRESHGWDLTLPPGGGRIIESDPKGGLS
jgi:DNA-binding transcriptional MerR regulator